jgi:hypothetical protein
MIALFDRDGQVEATETDKLWNWRMREEVRKGGDDEAKVELSKNTKLADFRSSFRVLAARLSERWGPL